MKHQLKKMKNWEQVEFEARQLFSPAAPINAADLFAGRREEIKRFTSAIAERGRHVILYGERGVGKTSLVSIFHFLLSESTQLIYIRKQASPDDNYTTLWRKVFRDLTYTITEHVGYGKEKSDTQSIADHYHDHITSDDVARELQKVQKDTVIIFDEFDKIRDIDTKKLMSHTIKLLSDLGVNSTIVIVGVADDINTIVDEHESVKRNLEEIKMPRMSKDELIEILSERLPRLNLEIDKNAQSKIVTLSRGLPEYVHALGKNAAIHAISLKKKMIDEGDVEVAIETFLNQSDQSSNNSYKKAIHSNKTNTLYEAVLLACALAQTDDEGKFVANSLITPLSNILHRKINIPNFQANLAAFCKEERGRILEKHGKARAFKYRFHEPKMQPYIIMKGILSGKINTRTLKTLLPLK
jgi:Cdc6-like AAA superfamily ATPase